MSAASKLTAARIAMGIDNPFFGYLALSLKMKPDATCNTAWVDGRTLGYNPAYVESLSHDKVTGLLSHEVMHCAMGHPWRREARDPKGWNIACDRAINGELRAAGVHLPEDVLYPSTTEEGKSAEWIYARLPQGDPPPQDDPQGGQGGADDSGTPSDEDGGQVDGVPGAGDPLGEVRDAPTTEDEDGDPAPTQEDWKQKAAQAAQMAAQAGKMPGGMTRLVKDALKPKLDPRALLLRFMTERAAADYTWTRPNMRYLAQGMYLPTLHSNELGEIAILCDTSGSIDQTSLDYAKGIIESVIDECNPVGVTLYFVDADVQHIERLERGAPIVWTPKGGGGTDFTSFFDMIERDPAAPVCVIGITDLAATFPNLIPSVPVIWLTTDENAGAPFGEVVPLGR